MDDPNPMCPACVKQSDGSYACWGYADPRCGGYRAPTGEGDEPAIQCPPAAE